MLKKYISLVVFFWFSVQGAFLLGQTYTQTLRGTVVDEASGSPVVGGEVLLVELEMGTVTNEKGNYRIEGVPAGRYTLQVSHPEMEGFKLNGLVVIAGKELVTDVEMFRRTFEAETVLISAYTRILPKDISTRLFTVEETKRFASVYWDPARLAPSFPGVVQANDQSNHLLVRGNAPDAVQWRMEGAEIVAPNHLNNAGTFSDRPTFSGGGTSMLSTQVMGNSKFSSGAFAAQYGNAIGGIFDVGLRKGNDEQFEFTAQMGLIGLDFSAEGPLSKKHEGSFLANYRYSTVGVLGLLGVPLGDERINYQDLAFHLHQRAGKAGEFSLFGLTGNSITESDHLAGGVPSSQKELFDIRYRSNTYVWGGKHKLSLSPNSELVSVVAASGTESSRFAIFYPDSLPNGYTVESDELSRKILSLNSTLSTRLKPNVNLLTGLIGSRRSYSQMTEQNELDSVFVDKLLNSGEWSSWMVQAFGKVSLDMRKGLRLDVGVHGLYYERTGEASIEPRVQLSRGSATGHRLSLAYGLHSQEQYPGTYTVAPSSEMPSQQPNLSLGLTKSNHFTAGYRHRVTEWTYFQIETYWQDIYNAAIIPDPARPISGLNQLEPYLLDSMVNSGRGANYGVELTAERTLVRGFYYLLSGTYYESKYQAADGIWRDSQWAGRYILSGNFGWEKRRESRKGKQQVFGINIRGIQRGGLRAFPIDLSASRAISRTVFEVRDGYEVKLPDYSRLDLRLTYQRNRKGLATTLALDIQNLLNTQNVAYYYYDFVADEVLARNQLGTIPVLSYRIEF